MKREDVAWRGLRALRYFAGGTSVVVVPERGAKIASLRDATGREWLAQGDGRRPEPLGTPFESAEMCGWDECAPSLEGSVTARGRGVGDHGDAWNRPWSEVALDRLAIDLPSVGIRLERRVSIGADGVLTLGYTATAGAHDTELLWAAHPLFRRARGDRVAIDARVLWDVSDGQPAGVGEAPSVLLNAPMAAQETAKYYVDPGERPQWARIDSAHGGGILVSWAGDAIRTLGVWLDRSRFATEDVVAFEPSTGWYDSLERATLSGRVLRLGAREAAEWSVSVAPISI